MPAAPFFSVGNPKFLIMYLGTFGVYQIYWMYKQWVTVRARTREEMWPVARAIFPIFFFYQARLPAAPGRAAERGVHHRDRPVAGLAVANDRIRGWNWLALLLGLPFFAFTIWIVFFPQT